MAGESLLEEVEKLQKLLKEGTLKEGASGGLNKSNTSNNSSVRMTRKRMSREQDALDKEARFIPCEIDEGSSMERESTQSFLKENASNTVSI